MEKSQALGTIDFELIINYSIGCIIFESILNSVQRLVTLDVSF